MTAVVITTNKYDSDNPVGKDGLQIEFTDIELNIWDTLTLSFVIDDNKPKDFIWTIKRADVVTTT
jgi:hypothetical protein